MQWWGTLGSNSSNLILLVRVWKYVCLDTHTSMAAEPDVVVTNKKTKTAEDWRWSGSIVPILRVVHVVSVVLLFMSVNISAALTGF